MVHEQALERELLALQEQKSRAYKYGRAAEEGERVAECVHVENAAMHIPYVQRSCGG